MPAEPHNPTTGTTRVAVIEGDGLARRIAARMLAGRSPQDYAIEFGEYLAKAAEQYRDVMNVEDLTAIDPAESRDAFVALNDAIYEFRKRAARALS